MIGWIWSAASYLYFVSQWEHKLYSLDLSEEAMNVGSAQIVTTMALNFGKNLKTSNRQGQSKQQLLLKI